MVYAINSILVSLGVGSVDVSQYKRGRVEIS
jgi:hypothetical protein